MFKAAGSYLKHQKCVLVPLASGFSGELARRYRGWIQQRVPEWSDFQVTARLLYSGLQLGPAVKLESWTAAPPP